MDQAHCHVLWSRRVLDTVERSEEQWFKKYSRAHPERGGAARATRFGHLHAVKADRTLYCDTMNVFLERYGHEARLHPDSLKARGFEREREPRALPSDSNAAKYQGEIRPRWQQVVEHRELRATYEAPELQQAQQAWEQRKVALGIHRGMDHEQQLDRVRAARERAVHQSPERISARQIACERTELQYGLTRGAIEQLRLTVEQVREESEQSRSVPREQERAPTREPSRDREWTRIEKRVHAWGRAVDDAFGAGAQVRLERERDDRSLGQEL